MNKLLTICLLFGLCNSLKSQVKQTVSLPTKLQSVKLFYGNGAELTHRATVQLKQGVQEVQFHQLSNHIHTNTINFSVPEGVTVLSYNFQNKTVQRKYQHSEIFVLEDSLRKVERNLSETKAEYSLLEEEMNRTIRLVENYAAGGDKNLTVPELMKLMDLYNKKIADYKKILQFLKKRWDDLELKKKSLQHQIEELKKIEGDVQVLQGYISMQLLVDKAKAGDFEINYYTQKAGWMPSYDIHMKASDAYFNLIYKAAINQNTGIDWSQVQITLTTNNPNQGVYVPVLNVMMIEENTPILYKNAEAASARRRSVELSEMQLSAEPVKEEQYNNDIATYTTLTEYQLNTNYTIMLPYDIPTDNQLYHVVIKSEKVDADFKNLSIPKRDKDVFLTASITQWEKLNLLPGNANVMIDNQLIGQTYIDPSTSADVLTLSLGRDKRIATSRNLVKDFTSSKVRGDFKYETIVYEIVLKNNKKMAAEVLLKDQFPISKYKEVEVALEQTSQADVNTEKGYLTWKVQLAPGESKKIQFSYTVKYPKEKSYYNLR